MVVYERVFGSPVNGGVGEGLREGEGGRWSVEGSRG